jgi:hypothetical protein
MRRWAFDVNSLDGDYSVSGIATSAQLQARVEDMPFAFPLRREATQSVGSVNRVEKEGMTMVWFSILGVVLYLGFMLWRCHRFLEQNV